MRSKAKISNWRKPRGRWNEINPKWHIMSNCPSLYHNRGPNFHRKDWILSFNRGRFEHVYKVTGVRYIISTHTEVKLHIHCVLSVIEQGKIVEYDLGPRSTISVIGRVIGISPKNHRKTEASLTTVCIDIVKSRFYLQLPEKYRDNPVARQTIAHQPRGSGATFMMFHDPRRTVDQMEGVISCFLVSTKVEEMIHVHVPEYYRPVVETIHQAMQSDRVATSS